MAPPETDPRPTPTTGGLPKGGDAWASGAAYEGYVGRWSRLVAAQFVDWLPVPSGARWLDVGCGTGIITAAILARCEPASVVGIDPSGPFLELAREAVTDPRVRFATGTAAETGQPDRSVEATVSGLVLNFVPDVDAALQEIRRVTASDGVIAAYVWDYGGGMEFMRRFWDAAVAEDPAAAPIAEAVRFSLSTPDALDAVFTRAGCGDVETRAIDIPTTFRDFDDFWRPFLAGTGPAPAYLASTDDGRRAAIRGRLERDLPAASDGTIPLTARAWAVRGRNAAAPAY
jgi:SAM-dependent methyltransferase